jgi:hypothetical protein
LFVFILSDQFQERLPESGAMDETPTCGFRSMAMLPGARVVRSILQCPGQFEYLVKGYQSAVTQVWVGSLINVLGEFAPDITRKLKKHKQ